MPDNDALYDVRERTKNPEHASVDDVVELCSNAHSIPGRSTRTRISTR